MELWFGIKLARLFPRDNRLAALGGGSCRGRSLGEYLAVECSLPQKGNQVSVVSYPCCCRCCYFCLSFVDGDGEGDADGGGVRVWREGSCRGVRVWGDGCCLGLEVAGVE